MGSFTSHKSMTPPTVAQCSTNWANRSTAVFMSAPLKQLLTGTEMRTFGTSNESRLVKLPTQNYTVSPLFIVRYICKALRFHGGQTLELSASCGGNLIVINSINSQFWSLTSPSSQHSSFFRDRLIVFVVIRLLLNACTPSWTRVWTALISSNF